MAVFIDAPLQNADFTDMVSEHSAQVAPIGQITWNTQTNLSVHEYCAQQPHLTRYRIGHSYVFYDTRNANPLHIQLDALIRSFTNYLMNRESQFHRQ